MARSQAAFTIRKPFGAPQTRGFSMSVLTHDNWPHIASNTNVVRVDIDTAESEPQTHAVFPAWHYGNDDTRLYDWHVRPAAGEEEAVAEVQTALQTELTDLQEIASPSNDQLQRIYELQRDLTDLSRWRYWQEVYNPFGDGAVGLYRSCAAPNVPFKLRSNWKLSEDKPITIWLHRALPHEGQQDSYVRLRFGHWALTIRQENSIRITRYKDGRWYEDDEDNPGRGLGAWVSANGRDFDGIQAQEDAIEAIRDLGRTTADEQARIAEWQQGIRDIRATLKKSGRTLTDAQKAAYKAQVTALQTSIAALKDRKAGLTSSQETQIKALQKRLVAFETDVQFQHMANNTIGEDMAITLIPQRRGYMVLHNSMGKDYCVIADEEITGEDTITEDTIIHATPLQIEGNGGAMWFKVSGIKAEAYAALESGVVMCDGVGGDAALTVDGTAMAGTDITAEIVPAGTGGANAQAFRWRVVFSAGGGYIPFLYRVYFDVEATARDIGAETVVCTSETLPDLAWTVGSDHDEDHRGRSATWSFHIPKARRSEWAFLEHLAHHQVQFRERSTWFTGVLADPEVEELGNGAVRVSYRCYDRWNIMRTDRVWQDVIGDGKLFGEYVRQIAAGVGLAEDEIIIEDHAVADWLLPSARPGEQPVVRPEWGQERASFLETLLDDHGPFLDLWFDGQGRLHLAGEDTTTAPGIAYTRQHETSRTRRVMRNVRRDEDWSEFVNDITVLGAKRLGKELSARYSDYSSVHDQASSRYVGRWIAAEPYQNKALTTQGAVMMCLRNRVRKYMAPRVSISFETDYDDTLAVGDRVRCDTETVEVVSISSDDRLSETMTVGARVVSYG